jgi:hypothetical protein
MLAEGRNSNPLFSKIIGQSNSNNIFSDLINLQAKKEIIRQARKSIHASNWSDIVL